MKPAPATLRRWRESPLAFVREALGVEPDEWQAKVLQAFTSNKRLAMKACKGPGKSSVLAWLCWNFLATRPHPKVVATSITGPNLRDGLQSEMSKWQQRSPFLKAAFTWGAERIVNNDHPETWWMSARTWSQSADPSQQANTLAGIHAEYVLIVADEAGGIPDGVIAAAEGGLSTGKEAKLVIAGNPTHLSGPLYRACTKERALWWVIEITGDPDDPLRSPRIDPAWAREQIQKYGRDNPWVLVSVFGQFPSGQSNALLSVEDVSQASRRVVTPRDYMDEPKVLGVDVARFGDDRTVFFLRQGRAAFVPKVMRNQDTMQVAGQVAMTLDKHKPDACFVDQTGIGAGVVDRLRQLGYQVMGVDNAGRPSSPAKYLNRRVEMWDLLAEWVKGGGGIPDDGELIAEMTAPTYKFDASGKLVLESKADLKKRGLPSPDKADALALTFAAPVARRDLRVSMESRKPRAISEYDPYSQENA